MPEQNQLIRITPQAYSIGYEPNSLYYQSTEDHRRFQDYCERLDNPYYRDWKENYIQESKKMNCDNCKGEEARKKAIETARGALQDSLEGLDYAQKAYASVESEGCGIQRTALHALRQAASDVTAKAERLHQHLHNNVW